MDQALHTILVVDDSSEDRELYRRYLLRNTDHSYTILEAALGQQGLDLCQQYQPDAVLLDYGLPDLDGLEFIAQLQGLNEQPSLAVVMLTGRGNEAIAVQAMKLGAQDYLVKEQITPEGLHRTVHAAIETVQLRTQLQQRIERERIFAQITQQIHQSLDFEQILQATVNEVRQFLHTDRVLVFRLASDGNGTVVAEAVGPQWRSLLSAIIYDPCLAEHYLKSSSMGGVTYDPNFSEDYVKRYRQGQATAIPDIHNSYIDPCHVELLAQFQVRANLVVPIVHDDQLWGLLIAHHCAAPREWQPLEIDLLKQLATQVGIALRQAELYQQAQEELTERKQVEAELRESQERLRSALEASRMGLWNWDFQTGRIQWSDNLEALFGMEPEEFDGSFEMFSQSLHPEDRDRVLATINQSITTGTDYEIEFRVVYPNGRIRWALSQGRVFYDQTGQPVRMAGNDLDITDRKLSAEILRESEERFRTSVENMLDCFAIYRAVRNQQGEIIDFQAEYVNDAACQMSQISREQHLGQGLCELLPGHRQNGLFDEYCQVVSTGHSLVKDSLLYVDEFGQQRLTKAFDIRVAKFGDGYVATWRDITDRKQAEAALRRSEARYRLLFESMEDGFCVIEMMFDQHHTPIDYRFLEVNPAFEQQTGLIRPEGKTARQLLPDLEAHWFEVYGQVALTGESVRFENGSAVMNRWFDVYAFPIGQPEGTKVAVLFKEISDRKQAEIERDRLLKQEQAARAEAEQANRVKDDFLAILSHELRSPLNPILGWAKLMQSRKFDAAKTNEALATIERNAKLQCQLIDDLLDIAKILRGKFSIDAGAVDLAFVIEAAIDTVRTAAIAKSIQLHPVLASVGRVSGDAGRLQQIVWNLLSNAIKFTPSHGRVDIQLERVSNWAQIRVSDTGRGINPAFLPYLFESFQQEDVSTTRKYGGLGLGLAIVRHLVEAHGGTIRADSPGEGQGATFTVQLPLLDIEPEQRQPDELPVPELDLTGIRVLIVDDEVDARELCIALLTQYGAEVLATTSAAELLAALESFQPDVLVSDMGMPEVDGYTLMQQIRALPPQQGGQIPAIALTAYARESDYQRAIRSGYQRHITKPLDPEQLVQAVITLAKSPPPCP